MTVYTRVGLDIDQTTNDLQLAADGNLSLATEAKAVGQHGRQRLQTYSGEWFLDNTAGVPWLDQILGRAYDPALAESVVKSELLDTDGVTEITSFSVSFDKATRGLLIRDVEVLTMFDEVANV
ncbi:hypothetical protein [Hoeflea alexandrii]|uniref:Phage tail protein n=1 Tax=Hoeflea alexandrii TaxID=288436 RepID=A0ABT1CP21_9HYPH|nr:hypothetical protein [Hoeflea alexandrii]MCO6407371.1 hypothetical protein [Hoeflea alexandrii]MCY0154232.1 hypothetical protein [Hoeflea alexandrii]